MTFISEEQQNNIRIKQMIFHIVGKHADRPLLFDELVNVKLHEDFFIARIKSTIRGSLYSFNEIAGTRDAIRKSIVSEDEFVKKTQDLSKRFQSLYDGDKRLSDGVLLFLIVDAFDEILFNIIKFDHEPSVGYLVNENSAGHREAVLNTIADQFSRHPEAMQKSALIRPNAESQQVCAIDRSSRPDISGSFQAFLDVKRVFQHDELTRRICNVAYEVGIKHQNELSPEIIRGLRHRVRESLLKLEFFDPENPEPLKNAIYGPLSSDHPLHKSFAKALERTGIAHEPITVLPSALPQTRRLMKETQEGIQIYIPNEAQDRIDEVPADGGESYIRIRTAGLKYDDIDSEAGSRRRS